MHTFVVPRPHSAPIAGDEHGATIEDPNGFALELNLNVSNATFIYVLPDSTAGFTCNDTYISLDLFTLMPAELKVRQLAPQSFVLS